MTKALFLDRDGVINVDSGYIYKTEQFKFTSIIFNLCHLYQEQGFLIFIVTNQSGIARGMFTTEQMNSLNRWMLKQFESNEITISDIYCCPHHPHYTGMCECRKPNTGLIDRAVVEYNIDCSLSILIGDKQSDVELGLNASIGTIIHVESNTLRCINYYKGGNKMEYKMLNMQEVSEGDAQDLINYLKKVYFKPLDYDYDQSNKKLTVYNPKIFKDKNIKEHVLICFV